MSTTVEKEWAAVVDDEILFKRDTERGVERELRKRGKTDEAELIALPKPHCSMVI